MTPKEDVWRLGILMVDMMVSYVNRIRKNNGDTDLMDESFLKTMRNAIKRKENTEKYDYSSMMRPHVETIRRIVLTDSQSRKIEHRVWERVFLLIERMLHEDPAERPSIRQLLRDKLFCDQCLVPRIDYSDDFGTTAHEPPSDGSVPTDKKNRSEESTVPPLVQENDASPTDSNVPPIDPVRVENQDGPQSKENRDINSKLKLSADADDAKHLTNKSPLNGGNKRKTVTIQEWYPTRTYAREMESESRRAASARTSKNSKSRSHSNNMSSTSPLSHTNTTRKHTSTQRRRSRPRNPSSPRRSSSSSSLRKSKAVVRQTKKQFNDK